MFFNFFGGKSEAKRDVEKTVVSRTAPLLEDRMTLKGLLVKVNIKTPRFQRYKRR